MCEISQALVKGQNHFNVKIFLGRKEVEALSEIIYFMPNFAARVKM